MKTSKTTSSSLSALLMVICLGSSAAQADMVEISPPSQSAQVVSMDRLLNGKGFQGNEAEIRRVAIEKLDQSPFLDSTIKAAIKTSMDELPFHRIVDVEISFLSGLPELVGICLEGHPTRGLAIEACAGTLILASTLGANIKYRWDLILHQTSSGKIHQLSVGPGFGIHGYYDTGCFDTCGNGSLSRITADVMGSIEYVYWIANHFGITAQLDAGASFVTYSALNDPSAAIALPTGKLTIGLAF